MGKEFVNYVGASGEAAVAGMFLKRGYNVFVPVFGTPGVDMIVDIKGRLLRIQVKTSKGSTSAIRYRAWSTGGETYDGVADWLALYSLHYGVAAFLKPEEAAVYPTIRYDRPKDSAHPTERMQYARDFSIDRVIKEAAG